MPSSVDKADKSFTLMMRPGLSVSLEGLTARQFGVLLPQGATIALRQLVEPSGLVGLKAELLHTGHTARLAGPSQPGQPRPDRKPRQLRRVARPTSYVPVFLSKTKPPETPGRFTDVRRDGLRVRPEARERGVAGLPVRRKALTVKAAS
jgi:hypothetical protein